MSPGQHIGATFLVVMIAALVFISTSRIGQRSVDHWLTLEERRRLDGIRWPWWVVIILTSVVISWHSILSTNQPLGADLAWMGQHIFFGGFVGVLMALTRIDLACRLLPDPLTAGLVLSGLMFHWLFETGLLLAGIQGAALGYGLLWLLARIFERIRGQEAMGRGDFFMTAGLGAWLGWPALPMVLMVASLSALLSAIAVRIAKQFVGQDANSVAELRFLKQEIPFGPALAFGGLVTWVVQYG